MNIKDRIVFLQNSIMAYRKPLYNMLANRYEVVVVHSGNPSVTSDDLYQEIVVSAYQLGPFFINNWLPPKSMRSEAKAIIVMFDLRWPNYILSIFLPRTARFILWGHRYSCRKITNFLRDFFMKKTDAIVLYGVEDFSALMARGIPENKIYIAHNTIDIPNHRDTSCEIKSSFLYVGRLQARKYVDVLIYAFSNIIDKLPPQTTLDIVGDGDIRPTLENLAIQLDIADRVRFHGAIHDHMKLSTCFEKAYAYVSDNVGLGILHSFAYGVPVITSMPHSSRKIGFRHGPEFSNLRNGENSLFYANIDELQMQMSRIASDAVLSKKLGHNAYQLYSRDRVMENMVNGICLAIEGN